MFRSTLNKVTADCLFLSFFFLVLASSDIFLCIINKNMNRFLNYLSEGTRESVLEQERLSHMQLLEGIIWKLLEESDSAGDGVGETDLEPHLK